MFFRSQAALISSALVCAAAISCSPIDDEFTGTYRGYVVVGGSSVGTVAHQGASLFIGNTQASLSVPDLFSAEISDSYEHETIGKALEGVSGCGRLVVGHADYFVTMAAKVEHGATSAEAEFRVSGADFSSIHFYKGQMPLAYDAVCRYVGMATVSPVGGSAWRSPVVLDVNFSSQQTVNICISALKSDDGLSALSELYVYDVPVSRDKNGLTLGATRFSERLAMSDGTFHSASGNTQDTKIETDGTMQFDYELYAGSPLVSMSISLNLRKARAGE